MTAPRKPTAPHGPSGAEPSKSKSHPAPADHPPKDHATEPPAGGAPEGKEVDPATTSPSPASGATTGTEVTDRLRFELAPEPPYHSPSIRGPLVFLAILILLAGAIYPGVVTLAADVVSPVTPHSLSTLLGENVSNPALFWLRPSQIDWQMFSGAGGETPYGPVDPALKATTLHYIQEYGLGNSTVPLDLVSPSASGLDPDLYPDAALIQVPRVAHYSNVSVSVLWGLVNDSTVAPAAGIVGPTYVNVITLDQLLLQQPQMAGAWI